MDRATYFDGGQYRLKIHGCVYTGKWVDKLAAYENTGLEPEEIGRAIGANTIINLAAQTLSVTPEQLWALKTKNDP
ncbi:MAG: hypothetical protein LUF28_05505 [Clostridiales bacterium]|nr:hypothetical protein [Clostridiales bacterium]